MKSFIESHAVRASVRTLSRTLFCAALIAVVAASTETARAQQQQAAAAGQGGRLQIDSLDRLAPKASESINVNLDERLMRLVPPVLSRKDPDEAKAREVILGLKGIYVKRFEFDAEGGYTEADVAPIRAQLREPQWSRIVEVRSRAEGRNVEVYLLTNGEQVDGLAVLSLEPKQLMVINIVGAINLEKLRELEGNFGITELDLETESKPQTKKK